MKGTWDDFKTIGDEEIEQGGPRRDSLTGYLWILFGMPLLGAVLGGIAFFAVGLYSARYVTGRRSIANISTESAYQALYYFVAAGAVAGLVLGIILIASGMSQSRLRTAKPIDRPDPSGL